MCLWIYIYIIFQSLSWGADIANITFAKIPFFFFGHVSSGKHFDWRDMTKKEYFFQMWCSLYWPHYPKIGELNDSTCAPCYLIYIISFSLSTHIYIYIYKFFSKQADEKIENKGVKCTLFSLSLSLSLSPDIYIYIYMYIYGLFKKF